MHTEQPSSNPDQPDIMWRIIAKDDPQPTRCNVLMAIEAPDRDVAWRLFVESLVGDPKDWPGFMETRHLFDVIDEAELESRRVAIAMGDFRTGPHR